MGDEKTPPMILSTQEAVDDNDDDDDAPPCYSSPAYSIASLSEVSVVDTLVDIAAEDDSGQASILFEEDQSSHLDTGLGPRTSAFIQTFMRPNVQPSLINVKSGPTAPQGGSIVQEVPTNWQGVSLDIVVMVAGEEIEPFLAISKKLLRDSHRVRIAAHAAYQALVQAQGVDFVPISQEPLDPTYDQDGPAAFFRWRSRAEDRDQIRRSLFQTYVRCWRACIAPYGSDSRPFVADAIIASPLVHSHVHCAECLSIPLHIMSSRPWSPTTKFPHPLAVLHKVDGMDQRTSNLLSYALIEESVWDIISEPINDFRQRILGLRSIAPDLAGRLLRDPDLPRTYLCSKLLVQRPSDWSDLTDISGYCFENEATESYEPAQDLREFLQSGQPPIFFLVQADRMKDPRRFARSIYEASERHKFRILLSSSCRELIGLSNNLNILVVDAVPHAWILPKISVLVHHATLNSTALALQYGKPSIPIPLSGDQSFWAISSAKIGASAAPLPEEMLSASTLAQAMLFCLESSVRNSTQSIQRQVHDEDGLNRAVQSFYRCLLPRVKKCSITQQDLAVYQLRNQPSFALSAAAAAVLLQSRFINRSEIGLVGPQEYRMGTENIRSFENSSRKYLNAVATATKDIASASNLVNRIPGLERKAQSSVSQDIAVGTGRFFGHIALLPFTATALAVNSVIYGVNSVVAYKSQNHDRYEPDLSRIADYQNFNQSSSILQSPSQQQLGRVTDSAKDTDRSVKENTARQAANELNSRPGKGGRNATPVEAIAYLRSERGFRDPRIQQPEFRQMVIAKYLNHQEKARNV